MRHFCPSCIKGGKQPKYGKNMDVFLDYLSDCQAIDLDKTIITSPTIGIVTYSLRDAIGMLMEHEHRHVNQAIRTGSKFR